MKTVTAHWYPAGIFTAVLGLAAPAQAIDLREAVARTLATSPDIGIAVEGRHAAGYEVEQASGLFLPSVDLRTTAGEQFTNDGTSRNNAAVTGQSRTVGLPRYEAGVTLRQLLFDGEESEGELALRTARWKSASRRVLQTSVSVSLDAAEAYLEALRHRELVALAEDTVNAHEQTLAHVSEMARGGAVGVADVKQAESRLARARDDFAQARNRMNDADAGYRRVVGEAVESLERPLVPEQNVPSSIAAAVELALASNAAIEVAKSEVAEAEAEYRKSRAGFFPKVNLEVSANSTRNLDGVRGSDADVSALLVMNYNLYRGGADVALRQSLISRLAESRQRLNRAIRVVEEQARLSWNALRTGRDRVEALQSQVRANEVVRVTYREQFDLNQRSLLDLLDSENDLFLARANLITSEFAVMFGVYRVLATTGRLLSALDITPPPEASVTGAGEAPRVVAPPLPSARPSSSLPSPDLPARAGKANIGRASPVAAVPAVAGPAESVATAPARVPNAEPERRAALPQASPVTASARNLKPRSGGLAGASAPVRAVPGPSGGAIAGAPLYWGFN